MPPTKVFRVNASKVPRTCDICQKTIPVGSPYVWFKFYTEPLRNFRCMDHVPTPIELTVNPKVRLFLKVKDAYTSAFDASNPEDALTRLEWTLDPLAALIDLLEGTLQAWNGTNIEYSNRYELHDAAYRDATQLDLDVRNATRRLQTHIDGNYEEDPARPDWTSIMTDLPAFPEINL